MYASVTQDGQSKGFYLKVFLTHQETETFTGHNPANVQKIDLEITGNVQEGLDLKLTNLGGRRLQRTHGIRACATHVVIRAAHYDVLFEQRDRSLIDTVLVAKGHIKTAPFPKVFWGATKNKRESTAGLNGPTVPTLPAVAKEIGLDDVWDAVARVNELRRKTRALIEFIINDQGDLELSVRLRPGHSSPVRGQPGAGEAKR